MLVITTTAMAEEYFGKCGENAEWMLDTGTGELIISGNGKITERPWDEYKSYIKSVVIQEGITSIETSSFSYCSNLTAVEIGNDVTQIGSYAFAGCSALKELTIGEGVTRIGACAFDNCVAINELIIPDSVRIIDGGAFGYCSGIESIIFGTGLTSIGNYGFAGCTEIRELLLPANLTVIGNYAFSGCSTLGNVSLNDRLALIGSGAFEYCEDLKSIFIPSSVETIGDLAFNACDKLKMISVSSSNGYYTSDEKGVLYTKDYRALIKYPPTSECERYSVNENTESLAEWAFYQASNLKELRLGRQIKSIQYAAFYACGNINSVYYDGLKSEYDRISIDEQNTRFINAKKIFCNGGMWGDTNSDGMVTVKDITVLRRFIVGGYDIYADLSSYDINRDDWITIKDVVELRKYIASGYGVIAAQ